MKKWRRAVCLALALFMILGYVPPFQRTASAASEPEKVLNVEPLSKTLEVRPGQVVPESCEIVESEIYGYVIAHELKKGHILSISNTDYVFSVRKLVDGNYSTMLKQATTASFTATEDMTVAMLVRKPDKSALTAEELANVVIYDTVYGMKNVEGNVHRFTVEAETIDGGTATTRAAIFLPESYSAVGDPTRLIVMTNGHSAFLTDSVWNKNTADNVGIIRSYLNAGYAVYVVDNTAGRTSQTPDIGCPQLVSSYRKAYEYIQQNFNVEEKISIHSRSFGTFAAMRLMQEIPELIKCAVMTGPRVSIKREWPGLDKVHIANRFGFEDTTGATYEADKMVGRDPYTDVNGDSYILPPTYWAMSEGDATAAPMEVIEKLIAHGNDVSYVVHTGTDHTGVCTLNTEEMFSAALAFLESHQEEKSAEYFAGKKVSILSHSMSTYAGVSNNTAYNSTIGDNDVYYTEGRLGVYLKDTWWQQAIDALGMELLVNNSWSGSCIFQPRKGAASVGYGDRAINLHNDHTGEEPDIIWVYLGCNDFAYFKDSFGKAADVDYSALITENGDGTYSYASPATACEAYAIMLHKAANRYPDADIYCMTSTARREPDYADNYADTGQPTEYMAQLHDVAEHFGFPVVDLEDCIPKEAEFFDQYIGDKRAHANALGMDKITNKLLSVMLGEEAEICHVTSDDGTVDGQAVLLGGSYTAKAEVAKGYCVSVTMGGEDITAEAYKDGEIKVENVTGDISVSAVLSREPLNFSWRLIDNELQSVGESENLLTRLGGTVTDDVINGGRYELDVPVVLKHDESWALEWKCAEDWRGVVFSSEPQQLAPGRVYISRTKGGQLCFGTWDGTQYNNYGVDLSGVDGQSHTYRLENRIDSDGSNMVWLYVDGDELGAMNNYYVGSSAKGTISDWVSGRDFAFSYIGSDSTALNNCALDYLEVWESGESFAGKTISILGDSISTYTGISNNGAYNSTIAGGAVYYNAGTLEVYQPDTWWQQTVDALDMELLVNNSWSGSCIYHTRSGTAGAYVNRCVQLHNDTTGEEPDVIAVFMGTNDYSYYQSKLGTADINYDTLIVENADGSFSYAAPATSCEAYAIMLHKMTNRYPDAEIYCMTLLPRREPDYDGKDVVPAPSQFNAELKEIISHFGCKAVDLENCGITSEPSNFDVNISDKRVHPGTAGMDKMTGALVSAMLGKKTELHNISCELTNVALNGGGMAVSGEAYTAELTELGGFKGLTVAVTMGGENITASCYADGVVSIAKVTADVHISASALERAPENFRWELDGDKLVSVGEDGNSASLRSGSVTDGVMKNAWFELEKAVILRHDQPWAIEFKASGAWSGMLLSAKKTAAENGNTYLFKTSTASGFVGFGERNGSQYENYGVALTAQGVDTTAEHVYRVENRIDSDGSNMVWLSVDGTDYGAMDNYFIGGSDDRNTKDDWLNGRDFVFSYIGASGHVMNNCALDYLQVWESREPMAGKTLSVLGASISTFAGTSNGAAADTANSTIRGNAKYYPHSVVTDVTLNDTWWMQLCSDFGLRLLVNNSWSGSSLLHERGGTVGAYVDRCVQLHDDTGENAGEEPDIIGIQMGTNDFQYYKDTLGTADIDYGALITKNADGTYGYAEPATSLEAAAIVLHKISVRYPNAEVYYLNISQRVDGTDELIRAFNAELKQVVEHFGAHIVDIYGSAITMDSFETYIGDGRVHPNCLGMDAYTEAFKNALLANTAYTLETHTVSFELDGGSADYGTDKTVVSGESFSANLSAEAGDELSVTVTMGGEDITDICYSGGKVSIAAVTADVNIKAAGVHISRDYRWEFDGAELACVSGENALTKKAGTTTDGVFSNTRYELESAVWLLHDLPWVVEWKCEGSFLNTGGSSGARVFTSDDVNANYNARYIFKSNTDGLIAMGEKTATGSHNYGVALADYGIDWTAEHTYRLENRIAEDGSNMVYLYVDGAEIAPMTGYYVGTKDQSTTSDWLSGKDFVFPYMGTDTHGFTNAKIDYVAVWEAGQTTPPLSLRYDDHYDVSGKTVEIIDAGEPTSYQVGYGVEENAVSDTAVVSLEGDSLVATGIGTAKVRIDGQLYDVTVEAAPFPCS